MHHASLVKYIGNRREEKAITSIYEVIIIKQGKNALLIKL